LAEVSSHVKQEILEAWHCVPDDLFGGLASRYTREKYYEDHFNLVVCYVAMCNAVCVNCIFHSLETHSCMYGNRKGVDRKRRAHEAASLWLYDWSLSQH
jgi:hypothetical protein